MEIVTTNFGYAGFLIVKYNAEVILNSKTEGIVLKLNTDKYIEELKNEYKQSDINKFNQIIRKIIYDFKNSK